MIRKLLFIIVVVLVNLSLTSKALAAESKSQYATLSLVGPRFLDLLASDKDLLEILIESLRQDYASHGDRVEKIALLWLTKLIELEILPASTECAVLDQNDVKYFIKFSIKDKEILDAWLKKPVENSIYNRAKTEQANHMAKVQGGINNWGTREILLIDKKINVDQADIFASLIEYDYTLKYTFEVLNVNIINENIIMQIGLALGAQGDELVKETKQNITKDRLKNEKKFLKDFDEAARRKKLIGENHTVEYYVEPTRGWQALRIVDHTAAIQSAAAAFSELMKETPKLPSNSINNKKKNNKKKKKHKKKPEDKPVAPVIGKEQGQQPTLIELSEQRKKELREEQRERELFAKCSLARTNMLKELHVRLHEKNQLQELQNLHKTLPDYQWFIDNKYKLFNDDEKQTQIDPILFAGLLKDLRDGLAKFNIPSVQKDLALLNSYIENNLDMFKARDEIRELIAQHNLFNDKTDTYWLQQIRLDKIAHIKEYFLDVYLFLAKTTLGDNYLSKIKNMEAGVSILGMDKNKYDLFVDELHDVILKSAANLNLQINYSSLHFTGSSTTYFSAHPNKGHIDDLIYDKNYLLNNPEKYLELLTNISVFDKSKLPDEKSDIDIKIFHPELLYFINDYIDINARYLSKEFLAADNNPAVHRLRAYLEVQHDQQAAPLLHALKPLEKFFARWEKILGRKLEINLAKGKERFKATITDGGGQRSLAEIKTQASGPFISTRAY